LDDQALVNAFDRLVASGSTPEAAASQLKLIANSRASEIDSIWADFERRAGVIRFATDPAALVARTSVGIPWYTGPADGDVNWPAVKARLAKSLPAAALDSVDQASSKVLSLVHAPGEPRFSTRGLVLGNVQSGKTTSFISVVSKAADRGFRIFIVLSGITDNLRSQTQQRVDDVLIAGDPTWYPLTTMESDFKESVLNAAALLHTGAKLIAVVKKNPARLRRLNAWLNAVGELALSGAPMIMIDDEADQASIDVGRQRTSIINGLMRNVLNRPKAAYVAYTATPFANLLIDPADTNDLYPRHFVVALPVASDYFGAERIFGRAESLGDDDESTEGIDLVRSISDDEARDARPPAKAISTWTPVVGPALAEAITWFLLASAARRVRAEGNRHSTMLVHTSMLAAAHERTAEGIEEHLDFFAENLASMSSGFLESLRAQYAMETAKVSAEDFDRVPIAFDALLPHLPAVLEDLRVIVDNYRSLDRLSYRDDEPATTIVVGGNTLSRGLTLEGLCSSYFVRSASTYDTLLQMGRWFGYRVGYEDLCRLWMTDDLAQWFRDLSLVEAEIRNEIKRYEYEGVSPEKVGVRIRQHPSMAVTSAVKMRNSVQAQMTYSGQRPQTILFKREDQPWLRGNIDAVRSMVARISRLLPETDVRGRRAFLGASSDEVLRFLGEYSFHEKSQSVRGDLLRKYIESELRADSLREWNIVFMTPVDESGLDLGLEKPLGLMNRSRLDTPDPTIANMKAIVSTSDRVADLDEVQLADLAPGGTDLDLQKYRQRLLPGVGLLCVYPIGMHSKAREGRVARGVPRVDLDAHDHVLGIATFFPTALNNESLVAYVTANTDESTFESLEDEFDQIEAADSADEIAAESVSRP